MKKLILILAMIMFATVGATAKDIYYCPMHPHYTSDKPGVCPICGMTLVKKVGEAAKLEQGDDHVVVNIDLHKQQMIGIRTIKAERRPLVKTLRTYGYVSTAMELYEMQNAFVDAYVAYVNVYGKYRRVKDRQSKLADYRELQTRMLESRDKLLKLGLGEYEIHKLENVSWSNVWQQPKLQLFNENHNYWVIAQIFEQDLGFVDVGEDAEIYISAYHEKTKGIVRSIGGLIDPQTRSANALIELSNYPGELVSNMLVDITLSVELPSTLLVPKEALLDSGIRKMVFVKTGEGRFEPRTVEIGWQAEEDVQIKSGLKEGEEVVIGGNFLLDSESRLQAAIGTMTEGAEHAH